jgi:hypothetical protein
MIAWEQKHPMLSGLEIHNVINAAICQMAKKSLHPTAWSKVPRKLGNWLFSLWLS